MVSQVLKKETATLHIQLEEAMHTQELMNGLLTLDQYKKILTINYLAHAAMEGPIIKALGENNGEILNIGQRRKLPSLQQDVNFLNIKVDTFPQPEPPIFIDLAQALGGMYVLEGATLGGAVIIKQLNKTHGLDQLPHFYYNLYGNTVGLKWKSFLQFLETSISPAQYAECVHKAKEVFEYFLQIDTCLRAKETSYP